MSILVSGSIACDTVLEHDGSIGRRLENGDMHHLNAAFLAPRMRVTLGGCATNIAFALRHLGGDPIPWGVVGEDGETFLAEFASHGIATQGIHQLSGCLTARCVIFTDSDGAQLSAFHPGALARGLEAPWPHIAGKAVAPSLAILSPAGREATLRAARECARRKIPYLFDVGQELPLFSREALLSLLERAFGIALSDFEAQEFTRATGWTPEQIAVRQKKFVLVTHGAEGASFWRQGEASAQFVEALHVDGGSAVGAGDAMRAGLLFGLECGLDYLEAVRLGAVSAAAWVRRNGGPLTLTLDSAREDYASQWGEAPF